MRVPLKNQTNLTPPLPNYRDKFLEFGLIFLDFPLRARVKNAE